MTSGLKHQWKTLVIGFGLITAALVACSEAPNKAPEQARVATTVLSRTSPESVGLSSERLGRMQAHFQKFVDDGRLAGLTTLVARKGKVAHFETYGMRDMETGDPTKEDTIYRIYSMTKPVTGIAMMMLYEEGHFLLNDPVEKHIPQFKDVKVFAGVNDDGSLKTVPQARKMTIRDLMTHTAGFSYGIFSDTPVDKLYRKAMEEGEQTNAALIDDLATAPLLFQPGSRWHYSLSVDIQGYLVEKWSGQTLDVFFEERIFKPLGMKDTGFWVPNADKDRFSELYTYSREGKLVPVPPGGDLTLKQTEDDKPVWLSGGGGLVSTTMDYLRFSQMVLNGGTLDGTRLLSPKTVDLMTMNHVSHEALTLGGLGGQGLGFGLDFAVVVDPTKSNSVATRGEYNWGGAANTIFWIDPEEEMVVILMTNIFAGGMTSWREELRAMVNQAVID